MFCHLNGDYLHLVIVGYFQDAKILSSFLRYNAYWFYSEDTKTYF